MRQNTPILAGKRPALRPISLALAVSLAALGSARADTTLPSVAVSADRDGTGLALDQASTGASRTGLSARELPASIEAVDSIGIEERGDYQIKEAITRATGLTGIGSGGNGGLAFSTRGFTGTNSVGIAEDGVRLATGAGTQTYPNEAWGYERIEVLHGPASVVYGSGTVGATINAVRKTPTRARSVETLFGVGSGGSTRAGAGASGALGEIASFRVDAYGTLSDGLRDLGKAQGGKLMSALRVQPDSDLRFELIADYSLQKPERYWGTPLANGAIDKSLRSQNYNVDDSIIRYEDKRLHGRVEWQASAQMVLRNELYYLEAKRRWQNVEKYQLNPASALVTRSSYLHIQHDMAQTGNRLEASLTAGGHRAVAGWEIARINFRHTNNAPYGGSSTVGATGFDHGQWSSPDATLPKFASGTTLNAFYLEDAYQIADRWLLLAGIRHDIAQVSRTDLVGAGSGLEKNLTGNAWRLGLTYRATRDTRLYLQTSTGHDPVTSIVTLNLANRDFTLTQGRQIEAGVKQRFAEGRGDWTAALYRIEKDDIITQDPANPARSIQGGSQHAQGIELASAFSPWKNWRFEANYTALQARYDALAEKVGGVALSRAGNRPGNVPEQVANLWAHYRFGDWQASLGGRHVGKRYADNANTLVLPAYAVADASLAWHYDAKTTFRALARNLTDKVYATTAYGSTQFMLGEARRFELVAEMKF